MGNEQRLLEQVAFDVEGAHVALEAGDVDTAKWELGRARDAVARLRSPKPVQEKRTQRAKPRQRPTSQNGGRGRKRTQRTPVAQRRSEVLEVLYREDKPLTATGISKRLGVSDELVRRTMKTIDADLLDVVKGVGTEPTRYALASQRETAGA